ncbi:MAG: sigma-70 family RNA polymerase sigma factor [Actinomycetia bacterium]|nr:sigma-70 family RNA polymerase sigma factor [Actinomycetes bacterium]
MPDARTDAQLVAAYLGGDRGALAGIYDRYSAGLYDTAAAMLRDRHEAADLTHDVFLIAVERLAQLREPERLKPWLYAVLRNEVYRRTKKRGRALPTDFSAMGAPEVAAPVAPDAEGAAISAAEMGELVRSAACGLDERDQLMLELSVRQGLQGADLAAALGVSADQSYTLVHRMRDRVDRSMTALVVARAGRKDCPELAQVLYGWDGEFTVLVRKRVARHIETCETCERTKRKAAPLALLGAAPAFAAPPGLRDAVLAKAGLTGSIPTHAYAFDADGGFPRMLRPLRFSTLVAGAAAAIVLGVGAGAIVAANTGDESAAPLASVSATTVVVDTSSTASTAATSSTTSTTVVTGEMSLSATVIDFGADLTSAALHIRNTGDVAFAWSVTGDATPFTIANGGGTLQPGGDQTLTLAISRTNLVEGDYERSITIVPNSGAAPVKVALRARVERAPVLTLDGPQGDVFGNCTWADPDVSVAYQDESALQFPAIVSWVGPVDGQNELQQRANVAVYGQIMTGPKSGKYVYTITVTDVRGNTAMVEGSFTIEQCIG